MLQYLQSVWQEIVVWLILGLVISTLIYYIGRRLRLLINLTHKNSKNCTSCSNCPHSSDACAEVKNKGVLED